MLSIQHVQQGEKHEINSKKKAQRIKMKLLAERAGVNQSTLSRILHNRQNVSPELAEKLAYFANQLTGKKQFTAKDFL